MQQDKWGGVRLTETFFDIGGGTPLYGQNRPASRKNIAAEMCLFPKRALRVRINTCGVMRARESRFAI